MNKFSNVDKLNQILDFSKPIVYIDIEASSNNSKPKILQIAAIIAKKSTIIAKFNIWSNPNEKINEKILLLLNKNESFFKKQESNKSVLKKFIDFIYGYNQIVCFGNYDQRILNYQYKTIKKQPIKLIDIQKIFFNKIISGNKISISLATLAEAFSVNNTQTFEHDALLDASMLHKIVISALEVESINNLHKIISKELITPRKKKYKKKSEIKISREVFHYTKDVSFVFFDLQINKKRLKHNEKIKYISCIKFNAKKFSIKGELLNELNKEILFNENNQKNVNKNLEWLFKKFYEIYFKNSILIYDRNFNLFIKFYKNKYNYLPIFYYVPYEYIKYYMREIIGNNFHNNEIGNLKNEKLFLHIKQKWYSIVNQKKS